MDYSDLKWHWNAPFATPEAKRFQGEDPQTSLERGWSIWGSFNKRPFTTELSIMHFQTFSSKPILIPACALNF